MKICRDHWEMMRDAVRDRGMWALVSKSSEAATEIEMRQLEEAKATGSVSDKTLSETFDPLLSMHWHYMNSALSSGGLYLMSRTEDGSNDGHYCPVCEFVKHADGFDAQQQISGTADLMRTYCIEQGKIARPS